MPPSFSGGLLCATAAVAASTSADAKTPDSTRFIAAPSRTCRIHWRPRFLLLRSCRKRSAAASAVTRGHAPRFEFKAFSAKRNDHCLNATTLEFASPLNPKAPFPEHD
jgi:hypothetical protein